MMRPRRRLFSPTLALALAWCAAQLPSGTAVDAASRPPVRGHGGAVASDERLATEVGLDALRAGGNAVDAAVATALALAVVAPEAGNLGGGGFAVVRMEGELHFLDFREVAPAAAHRDMYLGENGEPVAEASRVGPLATGVPGSPAGLHALHERLGRLPWAEVVAPARRLAADGFRVSARTVDSLADKREVLGRFPESAAVWLPGGEPPKPGALIRHPKLAETLRSYARSGPSAITSGAVAAAVEAASERHGGVLTAEDLEAYRPVWREPVRYSAFGWELATADLPSSGGVLLASTAWTLERLGYGDAEPYGADRAHLLAEAWRRAYADRFLLGDPSTTQAAASDLLGVDWLSGRLAGIDRRRATPSNDVQLWSDVDGGAGESGDTTHLSVVDADGAAVALTTTLNGLFGCGLWVPEIGFLNNEMDDFAAAPGKPNMFGLVQGDANAVRPGKRMLSSMSPTVAWRGHDVLVVGGRGGSRIPTATLQALLAVWLDGEGIQGALDRPRIHHQWRPDQLEHEPGALSPETRVELERRGHALSPRRSMAQVHAVRWTAADDGPALCRGASDPRGGGGVAGVVDPWP
ncbi:MAG: gamma-glutamyltransferase [Acidobacteriota bacterium]